MNEYRLEMKHINKSFAAMQALSDAGLTLKPGEANALLGINGAGKSTLIKILSGVYSKDSGQIFIDGKEVSIQSPQEAMELGIATVYQHPQLISTFTGYENIYLGNESAGIKLLGKVDRKELREKAVALAEEYHIRMDVTKMVSDMKPVEREMIAILNALAKDSKILILDEPTSILTESEKDTLFNLVKELKRKNVSIIFVTHRLDEVNEICDEITVLRDGKNVSSIRVGSGVDASRIAEFMLGKKMDTLYPPKETRAGGETVMEASGLGLHRHFTNIDLVVRKGEITGVFGLIGSGIDELSKTLFGAMKSSEGTVKIKGRNVALRSPRDGIREGVFLVPGDRQTEGYVGDQSIANNLTMAKMRKISYKAFGIINTKKLKKDAVEMVRQLNIATPSEQKAAGELSGGNQQKVVVGKGLYTDADIYIFCEPTVGVDVGAKYSIYEIMRTLSKNAGVLLISSDIEEIYGMADRVMVLNEGKVTLETEAGDTSLNEMLAHAISAV